MDTLITVWIMTLMLFARSGSARATTLVVSNQMKSRGNVPVFVTCHPNTKLSKPIALGQKTLIEIPSSAGDNEKAEASGELSYTNCVGSFYTKTHSELGDTWYVLYDSNKEHCKDSCLIVVRDDGFYRWNNKKRIWDEIRPNRYWF